MRFSVFKRGRIKILGIDEQNEKKKKRSKMRGGKKFTILGFIKSFCQEIWKFEYILFFFKRKKILFVKFSLKNL